MYFHFLNAAVRGVSLWCVSLTWQNKQPNKQHGQLVNHLPKKLFPCCDDTTHNTAHRPDHTWRTCTSHDHNVCNDVYGIMHTCVTVTRCPAMRMMSAGFFSPTSSVGAVRLTTRCQAFLLETLKDMHMYVHVHASCSVVHTKPGGVHLLVRTHHQTKVFVVSYELAYSF